MKGKERGLCVWDGCEIEGWRADVEMERGGGCESSFSMLLVAESGLLTYLLQ